MNRRVSWQNPQFDFSTLNPAANFAQVSLKEDRNQIRKEQIPQIAQGWGLMYFYRSDCRFCALQSPLVKQLKDTFGFEVLAVSLDGHKHYDTAAAVTCSILRALCKEPLRTGRILNINVPDLPLDQIKGIRVTRCGTRHPADQVIPQQDPRGNTLYWIGPPGGKCDAGPGTDFAAVDEGYVSITPLHVDLTAHSAQDVVSDWLNSVGVGTQW